MESILQIRDDASQASSFEKFVQDSAKDTSGRGLVDIVRRLLAEDVPQQVVVCILLFTIEFILNGQYMSGC